MPPLSNGCFVTGTDTEIGKTWFSAALCRSLRKRGLKVGVMKPVAAGAEPGPSGWRNEDALALIAASGTDWPYERVNPYCLEAPISPHIAAAEAGIEIDIAGLASQAKALATQADFLVVEGAGGWRAPLGPGKSIADLAQAIDLPVVLVVGLRLGCLNHAALSWQAIGQSGLRRAGWVANRIDPEMLRLDENLQSLTELLGEPPLADLAYRGPRNLGPGTDTSSLSDQGTLEYCVDRLMAP